MSRSLLELALNLKVAAAQAAQQGDAFRARELMKAADLLKGSETLAAERDVLAAILLDPSAFGIAATILHADDFAAIFHADIFRSFAHLSALGVAIDPCSLRAELTFSEGWPADGDAYVGGLISGVPRQINVRECAKAVLAAAKEREREAK